MRRLLPAVLAFGAFGPAVAASQARSDGAVMPASAAPSRRIDVARLRDTVALVLARGIADSAFPGAIAVVGSREGVLLEQAAGHLDWAPSPVPDAHTLWDLASLTKVIALTTAMMQLVDSGRIDLDAPVQRYLPEWTGPHKELVTVRHLLTHSSGLPAWRPLYKEAANAAEAMRLVLQTPLDTVPGVRMVYSDLGAILLGQIVVRVTGTPFATWVERRIFEPLGMTETMYRPPAVLRDRIAPTENDPWRQRLLRGEVHDENAYALGGVSAHAGLFSSAHDLARFARMLLNGGALDGVRIVSAQTVRRFTTVQDSAFSNRALGWEVPSGTNSAGHYLSSTAFGHTGFTGTSMWMDPANDLFVILLSNRVDPTRQHLGITQVRVALVDAVLEAAGAGNEPQLRPAGPRPD